MHDRYYIAWDLSGWVVIDTQAGRLAELNGLPLLALTPEDAEHAARELNGSHTVAQHPNSATYHNRLTWQTGSWGT